MSGMGLSKSWVKLLDLTLGPHPMFYSIKINKLSSSSSSQFSHSAINLFSHYSYYTFSALNFKTLARVYLQNPQNSIFSISSTKPTLSFSRKPIKFLPLSSKPPNFSVFSIQAMEQPASSIGPPPPTLPPKENEPTQQKKNFPTPRELVAYYESQGLETTEASMKVIEDLQTALVRVVSSGRGKRDKLLADTSRKLDAANTRLAILELKVDSKPGYVEALGIGVAAGAITRGAGSVMPHVSGAIGEMWNAVKSFTKT